MICGVKDCGRKVHCAGWCKAHYFRWKRTGDLREDTPIGKPTSDIDRSKKFWKFVDRSDGCWNWKGAARDGYGLFSIAVGSRNAHRYSWVLHNGEIQNSLQVLHRCDNRLCVNPDHLFLGTLQDNMADRNTKLRQARGEKAGRALLTEEQVRELRALRDGLDYIGWGRRKEIATQYGISPDTLGAIWSGKSWRHLL